MQSSPSTIYSQNVDKQRILVLGKNRQRIVQLILSVLKFNNRKCSYSTPSAEVNDDSPFIIIEPSNQNNLLDYHHHILIFSGLSKDEETLYSALADSTPKSGAIIYDESDSTSSGIAKIQRADVAASPYTALKHEMQNGLAVLITSTKEKYETRLSTSDDLRNIAAVKDLVKRIGVSSGQFYRAIAALQ